MHRLHVHRRRSRDVYPIFTIYSSFLSNSANYLAHVLLSPQKRNDHHFYRVFSFSFFCRFLTFSLGFVRFSVFIRSSRMSGSIFINSYILGISPGPFFRVFGFFFVFVFLPTLGVFPRLRSFFAFSSFVRYFLGNIIYAWLLVWTRTKPRGKKNAPFHVIIPCVVGTPCTGQKGKNRIAELLS